MKRVVVLFLAILVLGLAPTFASAQGFLPGLPSFSGAFGGPASCGEGYGPKMPGPTFYVGWNFRDRPLALSASTDNLALLNAIDLTHRYEIEGVWLGLSQTFVLSDNFSILGSGWYFIPQSGSPRDSVETYNTGAAQRVWTTRNEWWYADALLAVSTRAGGAFLAGLRYDFFTTKFRDPRNALGVLSLGTDQADLTAYNVIPLVGVQWACQSANSNLVLRAVGIPALVGSVKYLQPFAGSSSLESQGSWKRGYFFEVFGEASRSFMRGGPKIGAFVRWNSVHGEADLDIDARAVGFFANETYHAGFSRNTWTLGGNFQLDFTMPWPY